MRNQVSHRSDILLYLQGSPLPVHIGVRHDRDSGHTHNPTHQHPHPAKTMSDILEYIQDAQQSSSERDSIASDYAATPESIRDHRPYRRELEGLMTYYQQLSQQSWEAAQSCVDAKNETQLTADLRTVAYVRRQSNNARRTSRSRATRATHASIIDATNEATTMIQNRRALLAAYRAEEEAAAAGSQ